MDRPPSPNHLNLSKHVCTHLNLIEDMVQAGTYLQFNPLLPVDLGVGVGGMGAEKGEVLIFSTFRDQIEI